MSPELEGKIEQQRKNVFEKNAKVKLFAPCRIGEGILRLTDSEQNRLAAIFKNRLPKTTFFVPASGSGSRMFQFLYDFIKQPEESHLGEVEKFMNHLQDFAFYHKLPNEMRQQIKDESIDAAELTNYLMSEDGLKFGSLPKGLIPFHFNDPFVLNPFQEHILQGSKLVNGKASFHFTIQEEFEDTIKNAVSALEDLTGKKYTIEYSVQSKESNSIAFKDNGSPYREEDEIVKRPAGHGALLENLNSIEAEVVFVKNIDNVQHYESSQESQHTWSLIGGLLIEFRQALTDLKANPSKEKLVELNNQYQFLSPSEVNDITTDEQLLEVISRPVRVAGMVRNEGQPGGGPFWISDENGISKQIVEKAQIEQKGEQYNLMIKSTHFNPVMIALSTLDLDGNKLDLQDFVDEDKFFVVEKTHAGSPIKYMELPGLWNGSMAYWNTIFIEVSPKTFSPVKTILDLLHPSHLLDSTK